MPDPITVAILILFSFLAGGIPTGYLVVRRVHGFDIRERGSGNPGTANVYRMAGAKAGVITLLVDALKGYLPVLLALRVFHGRLDIPIICGVAAIVGHDWTPFLGFRGGKGVATSAGVFLALMPGAMGLTILVFAAAVALSKHISVGSIAGSIALPAFNALLHGSPVLTAVAGGASALILYKHIPNIKRLLQGSELHFHGKAP